MPPPRPLAQLALLLLVAAAASDSSSSSSAPSAPAPSAPAPSAPASAESPPLLLACAARDEARALELLDNATLEEINFRNAFGDDALIWACKHGLAKAAMELVLAGADVNSRSSSGDTPLTWASLMGLEDVALELLARGSDVDTHVRGEAVVMTPLAFATREGHARLALALIERGADVNGGAIDGRTPLVFAVASGLAEVVPALLARGARADTVVTGGGSDGNALPRAGSTAESLCAERAAAGDAAMARQCAAVRAAAWAPRRLAACERMLAACVAGDARAARAQLATLREGPGVRASARAFGGPGPAVMEIVRIDCQGAPAVRDALLDALLAGDEDPRVTWLERVWWWRSWRPRKGDDEL
jgi:hypothetical protein